MNQHSFQKAYYDSFCDVGGQVWVFPKGGDCRSESLRLGALLKRIFNLRLWKRLRQM